MCVNLEASNRLLMRATEVYCRISVPFLVSYVPIIVIFVGRVIGAVEDPKMLYTAAVQNKSTESSKHPLQNKRYRIKKQGNFLSH